MRHGLDLTVQRYTGKRQRWHRLTVAALALVCALAAGLAVFRFGPAAVAWLAALPQRVENAIGDWVLPHYTSQLAGLAAQNASLRASLADTVPLQEENRALRSLLESPAADSARGAEPLPVARRTAAGFALPGSAEPGAAILDPQGRFAGRADPESADQPGLLPVAGPEGTPCLADGVHGVLQKSGSRWLLAGLPRHCTLAPGSVVTTADGWWVGTVAQAPAEDETGLCAQALLTDTADQGASIYFAVVGSG